MPSIIKVDQIQSNTGNVAFTGNIAFPAGSASSPSITAAGDTNTGIFFPAADTIAFTEGGVEGMRITSADKVGIGVTAPTSNFEVNGSTAVQSDLKVGGTRYFSTYADVTQVIIGSIQNTIFSFRQNDIERMQLDTSGNLRFNSGYGSVATAFGCRAWVNWNGLDNAIRGSGNVSSITDNGTGDYTVNFTTAMPDANYCVNGISSDNPLINTVMAVDNRGVSAGSIRVATFIPSSSNALTDRSFNFVSIVR